jgi:hypothetical protein
VKSAATTKATTGNRMRPSCRPTLGAFTSKRRSLDHPYPSRRERVPLASRRRVPYDFERHDVPRCDPRSAPP